MVMPVVGARMVIFRPIWERVRGRSGSVRLHHDGEWMGMDGGSGCRCKLRRWSSEAPVSGRGKKPGIGKAV